MVNVRKRLLCKSTTAATIHDTHKKTMHYTRIAGKKLASFCRQPMEKQKHSDHWYVVFIYCIEQFGKISEPNRFFL